MPFVEFSILFVLLAAILAALVVGLIGARKDGKWGGSRARRRSIQIGEPGGTRIALDHASSLGEDLDAAIVRNELFIVHQPKMRARTGEITAVETLVRWQHPSRGLVSPNDFIGLAEERGEMRRITDG